jgi:hypothetical protein
MRELTNCQAKNARSRSRPSASFQLQPPCENLLPVKPRMPGADQDHQLLSSSSHHERTYSLSSQECQEQIKTKSFIPAPATMRELTCCQAMNARSRSRPSASFQLQPPCENLQTVKARMPAADQDHQLHSSFSHQERTYKLSSQECQEQIKTLSFNPAPATMRELTSCQAKNARSRSRPSASIQLQPPRENLLPVKPRMPGADQDHQLHSSSSHQERTYSLSSQECQEQIKTISFIPATSTLRELTYCQAKNARSRSRPSASFQLQPPCKNLLPVKPRMPGADQDHQLHSSSSHHERTYCLSSQ